MPASRRRAPLALPVAEEALPAPGGTVAALHREIEYRLGTVSPEPRDDRLMRLASRGYGFGALVGGYIAVTWYLLG